jgi:hypothetical protein
MCRVGGDVVRDTDDGWWNVGRGTDGRVCLDWSLEGRGFVAGVRKSEDGGGLRGIS